MILHTAPQGSPEWLQSRAGLITASTFVEIRKRLKSGPNKGDFSSFANDVSNTATNLGTVHSRTISNLSAGTTPRAHRPRRRGAPVGAGTSPTDSTAPADLAHNNR